MWGPQCQRSPPVSDWSGARDLNHRPHGPEIHAGSSMEVVFDGIELISRTRRPVSRQIQPPNSPGLLDELLHEWASAWPMLAGPSSSATFQIPLLSLMTPNSVRERPDHTDSAALDCRSWLGARRTECADELGSARSSESGRHIPTGERWHTRNCETGELVVVKGNDPVTLRDDVAEEVAGRGRAELRRRRSSVADRVEPWIQPAHGTAPGFGPGLVCQSDQPSDLRRSCARTTNREPAHPIRIRKRGDPHQHTAIYRRVPGQVRDSARVLPDHARLRSLPAGRGVDHA